ncbi:oligopeptide ABC transporter substrate-binding protein [Paenibacillus hunanensis]|uniref:Peptide/nickel transport system substrate-binding protein n=1 Tax=Paenibacillus hunanensis TaxID=539262 RepID=A0ABU1J275_9BACL|nr:oligopeptide ABC transporter substrate-binding protein [Paenibacillus hunanensis]MDR6245598.1 peptide/nickel transport system substrate-binding protein [Paenibacillus hunanensis]GGJ28769.1 ABC transporter substrate-binding protein [Paenibacillus hunanensis]
MLGSKKRSLKTLSILMIALVLVLSACTKSTPATDTSSTTPQTNEATKDTGKFPKAATNQNPAIQGGTMTYGLVSDTPFEGILNPVFYSGNPDFEVIQFFYPSLFNNDASFNIKDGGAATLSFSQDNKTATVKIDDKLNWTDGNPVTAEDYAFAFEVIGNPDYDGVRYDSTFTNIVGMEDYHAKKAKTISGIKVVNDKELQISFISPDPSIKAGLWSYPLEKKVFGDIPVAKMSSSDPVRKNPIGYGPFKIKSMVTGESVQFEANKDYFHGAPKLDGVNLKVVNPSVIVESLRSGDIDMASFPTSAYDEKTLPTNIEMLGVQDLAYSYLGFKLGKWDKSKGENVMNPDAKMANKSLRQAMGYAMNNAQVGEQLYHGLRTAASSLIIPAFSDYYDPSIKGYTYDPEKAKQLLDQAGYVDKDGDGFREDPKGNKLVINFASMSGDSVAEPLAQFYIQNWKDVGLNVQLLDGRLQEFNSFYDRIEKDDPDVDIYSAAWGTGTDVNPAGLYGRTAQFDYSRYTSEENDKLLKEGVSEKAFDNAYRKDVYKQWQELMIEDAPVIPTLYRYGLTAINKRIKNFDISYGSGYGGDALAGIELTSETPIK